MTKLLSNDFFRVLFNTIPVLALVYDSQRKVRAINSVVENLLGLTNEEALLKSGGEVFRCIHTKDDEKGCGYGPSCKSCIIRKTAMEAVSGQIIKRAKGKLSIQTNKGLVTLNILVSSSPLKYDEEDYAIVIIEDVSNITELTGYLPVCAACKNIQDEKGQWITMEHYVSKHSEAEFTHGICPDCVRKLYPSIAMKSGTKW